MTSVLDRRNFLTGSLLATLFAISEQALVMQESSFSADEKNQYLFDALTHYFPQVDEDVRREIANKYGDVKISPVRSLATGASVGATYAYLEIRKEPEPERPHKNSWFDRIAAPLAVTFASSNAAPALSGVQSPAEIANELAGYGSRMSADDTQRMSELLSAYQHGWQSPRLGLMPAAMTALLKESWETILDKIESNADNNDDNGPR